MPKAGKSIASCSCSRSTCFHSCYCILAICIFSFFIFSLHQRAGIAWVFGFCFFYALTEVSFGDCQQKRIVVRYERVCSFLFLFDLLFGACSPVLCTIRGLPRSRPDYC
jgi:hypothetical protein